MVAEVLIITNASTQLLLVYLFLFLSWRLGCSSMLAMKQKIVAVILARGGSKGVPRKNLMKIGGVPIVARSVLAAQSAPSVNEVYVSTDDQEIASIAKEYGAKIVNRPAEFATDTASSEAALIHFAGEVVADVYVFLQCTSPFTTGEDIEGAIAKYNEEGVDSVLSVTEDHGCFLCGGFTWDEEGNSLNYDYQNRPRRQDMKVTYRENGAIYVMGREGLFKYQNRLHGKVGIYFIPRLRSFEIDEKEDFSLAEHHFAWLKENGYIKS